MTHLLSVLTEPGGSAPFRSVSAGRAASMSGALAHLALKARQEARPGRDRRGAPASPRYLVRHAQPARLAACRACTRSAKPPRR